LEDVDIEPLSEVLFIVAATLLKPLTFPVVIGFVVMLVLLICSALISGAEIAFFSLNQNHTKTLRTKSSKTGNLIISLLEKPKRLLATILIANNFVNVSIVILSTFILNQLVYLDAYPWLAFTLQVIVITSLILILGEITPKIYSAYNPLIFASFMASPMRVLIFIFYPLSSVLVKSSSFIDKRISMKGSQLSMSELSEAIELTSDENTPDDDRKILKGIVRFGDIDCKEIMKSRVDVTAVDVSTSYDKLLKTILESGYSRIPAYQDNFDKIAGIVYVKDFLPHLDKPVDFNWKALLRPAFFIPENKKINDLLEEFQEKKIHMAVVVDEYGGTSGIVTLEDIIEEIVGDISDEFDTAEDEVNYTKIDENKYLFEGKTLLNDFCKILNIDDVLFDVVRGDSETLAGLILELEGKIPKANESTKFQNFEFKVKKVNNRRIEQILVTLIENKN